MTIAGQYNDLVMRCDAMGRTEDLDMMGTRCMGGPDPMYGQSGEEGGPLAYPCQDLCLLCGIGVVHVGAVLQLVFPTT